MLPLCEINGPGGHDDDGARPGFRNAVSGTATFVVIGANLAGGAAVTTLREQGFDGRLVLIGAEEHPPYERPPLSKTYLRGESTFDDALLHAPEWYQEHEVETLFGSLVERVDAGDRTVRLRGGTIIPFDRALIATGARNRRFDVPGRDLPGVFQLRTIEDAHRIRERAAGASAAVVVGAGFIGCEVAASLRTTGLAVDVIDRGNVVLERVLGPEVAPAVEALHADHGVRIHHRSAVRRFEGAASTGVEIVTLESGEGLPCDMVVIGVGVEPVTDVVDGSQIALDNGIVTDAQLRTTAPDVFAAGDVANAVSPVFGRRLRVEHWDNALKSGAAAARNMLGAEVPYDDPHWFWSDQFDANVQYAGHATAWDSVVVRGSMDDPDFLAFYLEDGILRGVLGMSGVGGMNRGREVRRSMSLVKAAARIDPRDLADEAVEIKALAERVRAGAVAAGRPAGAVGDAGAESAGPDRKG
jgi:3-phenylpropionate/trans-cinnamate dioxygenase ferredoxin reductase subunit